jgi:hypothetical protein
MKKRSITKRQRRKGGAGTKRQRRKGGAGTKPKGNIWGTKTDEHGFNTSLFEQHVLREPIDTFLQSMRTAGDKLMLSLGTKIKTQAQAQDPIKTLYTVVSQARDQIHQSQRFDFLSIGNDFEIYLNSHLLVTYFTAFDACSVQTKPNLDQKSFGYSCSQNPNAMTTLKSECQKLFQEMVNKITEGNMQASATTAAHAVSKKSISSKLGLAIKSFTGFQRAKKDNNGTTSPVQHTQPTEKNNTPPSINPIDLFKGKETLKPISESTAKKNVDQSASNILASAQNSNVFLNAIQTRRNGVKSNDDDDNSSSSVWSE